MRPTSHQTFLEIALVLSKRSTCKRRQVGCVAVDQYNYILSTGYNGVGKGLTHCIDSPCPGSEYSSGEGLNICEAIHAEQNALLQCPNVMAIRKIYSTTSPCIHCAKLILNTGTREVFYLNKAYDIGAILLLHSAKIECTRIFMPDERFADAGI